MKKKKLQPEDKLNTKKIRRKPNKKRLAIVIGVVVAAAVVAGAGYLLRNSKTVKVVAVSSLNETYWGNEVSSYGVIRNDQTQEIQFDYNAAVSEVFVKEGQAVNVGDKLLAYDKTQAELVFERKQLEVQKLENEIKSTEAEIQKLKNTTPIVERDPFDDDFDDDYDFDDDDINNDGPGVDEDASHQAVQDAQDEAEQELNDREENGDIPEEDPSPAPEPTPQPDPEPEPDGDQEEDPEEGAEEADPEEEAEEDANTEADSDADPKLSKAFFSGANSEAGAFVPAPQYAVTKKSTALRTASQDEEEDADPNEKPESDPKTDPKKDPKKDPKPEPTPEEIHSVVDEEDQYIDEKTGDAYNYICLRAVPYNEEEADGSRENPYRFLCTPGAYVLGEYLIKLSDDEQYAIFEMRKGNEEDGKLLYRWAVDGTDLVRPEPNSKWSILHKEEVNYEIEHEDLPEDDDDWEDFFDEDDDDFSDWSQPDGYTAEELKEAIEDAEERLQEANINKRKAEIELKTLELQKKDGIVRSKVKGTVKTVRNPEECQNGEPIIEIADAEGFYVTGAISELMLGEVKEGQTVTISAWESGIKTTGVITEFSDTPTKEEFAYSEGNPNASYYPYTVFIEDTEGLHNGEYVDMSMDIAQAGGQEIYLPKAYVNTDEGGYYCMVANEQKRLEKRYVKAGKIIYGTTIQILGGLSTEDWVAFPYGSSAVEGRRTVESDDDW